MSADRELLLYIAAKVARLDAITSAIHSILYKDLSPSDHRLAEQRKWVVGRLYSENIDAERQHLQNQFPEDYKILDQHITLGETEIIEKAEEGFRDILEGRVDIPEAFQEPPEEEDRRCDS
jgi:hypothetical protein